MIGRSGERRSGISVLAARHDDHDDDEDVGISVCLSFVVLIFFMYKCARVCVCVVTIITKERIIIINLYYEENKLNR